MDVRKYFKDSDIKRIVVGRIPKNTDLLTGIKEVCKSYDISHGYIASLIGSLKNARFVYAINDEKANMGIRYSDPVLLDGPLEILAGQGIIGLEDTDELSVHLHMLISDEKMRVFGGHFIDGGNDVLVTAEIIIHEIDEVENRRVYDEDTGFLLFKVR
ncbi:PPC domain-containing DNA-binding protein [Lutispora sp.]|uniref:PPC domain-containing DNA-binding protein n=1 Tax=Lutispora sp. TaxID=2828727 RepID=UPI003566CB97